jgi:hypothetical protein
MFRCFVFYHLAIHSAASFLSLDRPRILPGKRQQCHCQVCHQSTAAVRAYPAKMENKPTWELSEVTFLLSNTASQPTDGGRPLNGVSAPVELLSS